MAISKDISLTELNQIDSETALEWAREQNTVTLSKFAQGAEFNRVQSDVLAILEADDKIPAITLFENGMVFNFWRDKNNVRGICRITTLEEYKKPQPAWDTVLDIDKLAADENENWVWSSWSGFSVLRDSSRALVALSRGGNDAQVIREFDFSKKEFVADGFYIPEAKSLYDWVDENNILIATDFGDDSLTLSSYPRTLKLLQRGQALSEAREVFSIPRDHMAIFTTTEHTPSGDYAFFVDRVDFHNSELYQIVDFDTLELHRVAKPSDAHIVGMFNDKVLLLLTSAWGDYPAGALVSLELPSAADDFASRTELILAPTAIMSIEGASQSKDMLLVSVTENVTAQVYRLLQVDGQWVAQKVSNSATGNTYIYTAGNNSDLQLMYYSDFLTPPQMWLARDGEPVELLKQAPERFDASKHMVQQFHATSFDGTQIPYWIIHPKDMQLDQQNPTILYGYGGFQVSLTPDYLTVIGKTWLEDGNVFVVANIRGGGEFGPEWHQAAIREKRQVGFNDFIAVAEDLKKRGVTSQPGIWGGSNGGLLVSAVTMQRPELFGAVICAVPLTNMLEYHKFDGGAGASWVAEYGDPEDPAVRAILETYSPLHNVKSTTEIHYPPMFITTSKNDNRVHPAHARTLAAKLQQLGHNNVCYYEYQEGGHQQTANSKEVAFQRAMEKEFWRQHLCTPALELVSEVVEEVVADIIVEETVAATPKMRLSV